MTVELVARTVAFTNALLDNFSRLQFSSIMILFTINTKHEN